DVLVETLEEALHRPVVLAGAFDSDEEIAELMLVTSLLELLVDGAQGAVVVGEFGGWNQHGTEEIGKQELGACFGAIDTDDAEVLGPHRLDATAKLAARLVEQEGLPLTLASRRTKTSHRLTSQKGTFGGQCGILTVLPAYHRGYV